MRVASFAKFIPDGRATIEDVVASSGASPAEAKAFGRLFGFEQVAVSDQSATLVDAFHTVLDEMETQGARPDTLIYVHGNPAQYPHDAHPIDALIGSHPLLAEITDWFEMDQQNCSTLFWGLDAANRLLQNGSTGVLVLAGDCLSGLPLDERYAPGVTAIGDAFVGLLLDGAKGGAQIENIFIKTRSEFYSGRFGTSEQTAAFNASHGALVSEILDKTGFASQRSAPVLPHNVNRLSWTQFARDTGLSRDQIWTDLLPNIGHCYTVDAASMIDRFMSSDHDVAHMLSVGQGGFLGGCQIRKEATQCK